MLQVDKIAYVHRRVDLRCIVSAHVMHTRMKNCMELLHTAIPAAVHWRSHQSSPNVQLEGGGHPHPTSGKQIAGRPSLH